MKLDNPNLPELEIDHFHHLGFTNQSTKELALFEDVKFVCLSGSNNRVKNFVKYINEKLNYGKDETELLTNLCLTDRYVMYKVGPILVASHGMGIPSSSIIMNEIFKVLYYVKAKDVTFFRIGTSGGIGIKPGTVVLTKRAVDGCFEPKFSKIVLGEVKESDTEFRHSNFTKLIEVANQVHIEKDFEFVVGDTMCCDDFYEGQGRIDGAFCQFTKEDRMNYLKKARGKGVLNIEMESLLFASMCNLAEVNGFVVCVTLVNRLESDQMSLTKEEFHEFESRPWDIVLGYIKSTLGTAANGV